MNKNQILASLHLCRSSKPLVRCSNGDEQSHAAHRKPNKCKDGRNKNSENVELSAGEEAEIKRVWPQLVQRAVLQRKIDPTRERFVRRARLCGVQPCETLCVQRIAESANSADSNLCNPRSTCCRRQEAA